MLQVGKIRNGDDASDDDKSVRGDSLVQREGMRWDTELGPDDKLSASQFAQRLLDPENCAIDLSVGITNFSAPLAHYWTATSHKCIR